VHYKEFLKDNSNNTIRIDEMSRNRIQRVGVKGLMESGKDSSERETISIENRKVFNAFNLIALMLPEKYERPRVRYYRIAVCKTNTR
jgi:hypothetical protein